MPRRTEARIVAATEVPYQRRAEGATADWLARAVNHVLDEAGLPVQAVDGLGVCSFSHAPDRAIDLAWSLGMRPRWIMDDGNGGASALNVLQHALRAIEAGDAEVIVIAAGDVMGPADFTRLTNEYNATTRDWLAPLEYGGPNAVFAMLTQRQMQRYGLTREDYGRLVVMQREHAARNPGAVYRQPLSLEQYLAAPLVADPLGLFDCVPVVAGADAIVLAAAHVVRHRRRFVRVRALKAQHNPDHQEGDGLQTGLADVAHSLWQAAGIGPDDVDVAGVYDDYPAMTLAQLIDLGFVPDDDVAGFIQDRLLTRRLSLNVSGGMLSAGQAGVAGGMHGLVEVCRHLLGQAGERQVTGARWGLVSGYGMVEYRYGMCANAAILQRGGR